jgi:hypothetical protein
VGAFLSQSGKNTRIALGSDASDHQLFPPIPFERSGTTTMSTTAIKPSAAAAPAASIAASAKAAGLNALAFSARIIDKFLADFPADKRTVQPFPGANHAAWIIGHIASTNDHFRTSLGKNQKPVCPESWGGPTMFGMKSEPTADNSRYPSWIELTGTLKKSQDALAAWFSSMTEAQLAEPMPEKLKMFGADFASLMSTMAVHQALHFGQLSALRRAFALPRAIG